MAVEEAGSTPVQARPASDFGYDSFGELTRARDPKGAITATAFDATGRPVRVDLPPYARPDATTLSPFATTTYGPAGNVVSSTDPRGQTTTFAHDTFGRLVSRTDPQLTGQPTGGVWRYSYDDAGNVISRTDPAGAVTSATYDDRNRVRTSTVAERSPSAVNLVTSHDYDDLGGLTKVTTPANETSTIAYNSALEPVLVTDATSKTSTASYDLAGRLLKATDPLGRAQSFTYDLAGRPTALADLAPGGAQLRQRSFGYDLASNRTSATTPLGAATTYAYDPANRRTSQVEPVAAGTSITTGFGYDPAGNQTRVTDGNGNATVRSYNPWGLPATVVEPPTVAHPAGVDRTWTATYDSGGLAVRLDAPGGAARIRSFDELGALTTETGSGAEATTTTRNLGYDLLGRLISTSTPSGTQSFSYDDRDNVVGVTGPGGTAGFGFDADGRMTSRTDVNGSSAFTWTPRSELKTASDPLTGATRTFTYDPAGQLSTVDFGTGNAKRTLAYDNLGRPVTDTLNTSGGSVMASTAWTYDPDDNVSSRTLGPAGVAGAGTHSFSYDRADRLISSTTPSGAVVPYEWNGAGHRTRAGSTRATYDARNRLLTEAVSGTAAVLFSDDWTGAQGAGWNTTKWTTSTASSARAVDIQGNEGRIWVDGSTARATAQMSPIADSEAAFSYRFSSRGATSFLRVGLRASGASGADQMPNAYRLEVQSDSATVKLQKFVNSTATTIASFTYTTDTDTQLVRFRVQGQAVKVKIWPAGAPEPAPWTALATDPAITGTGVLQAVHSHTSGSRSVYLDNLTISDPAAIDAAAASVTTTAYAFSPRGTLASRTPQGGAAQPMTFDAFDRLISDGPTTYAYDGLDRVLARGASAFTYAGTEREPLGDGAQSFARGPSSELFAVGKGTTKLATLTDPLHGDLVGTFAASGSALSDSRAYGPFGTVLAETGTTDPNLGFQAQWTDPSTNKVAMGARVYDPSTGAFTSRDSWDLPPDPSTALNRYAYGNANPLRFSDPSGHLSIGAFVDDLVGFVDDALEVVVEEAPRLVPKVGGKLIGRVLGPIGILYDILGDASPAGDPYECIWASCRDPFLNNPDAVERWAPAPSQAPVSQAPESPRPRPATPAARPAPTTRGGGGGGTAPKTTPTPVPSPTAPILPTAFNVPISNLVPGPAPAMLTWTSPVSVEVEQYSRIDLDLTTLPFSSGSVFTPLPNPNPVDPGQDQRPKLVPPPGGPCTSGGDDLGGRCMPIEPDEVCNGVSGDQQSGIFLPGNFGFSCVRGGAERGGGSPRSLSGAESAAQGARLNQHLRQLEKYGQGGFRELESSRLRYYGELDPAAKAGEMAGRRLVREWDPATGYTRTWHETLDHSGQVRQVRPETGGPKTHYTFDEYGNYTGSW